MSFVQIDGPVRKSEATASIRRSWERILPQLKLIIFGWGSVSPLSSIYTTWTSLWGENHFIWSHCRRWTPKIPPTETRKKKEGNVNLQIECTPSFQNTWLIGLMGCEKIRFWLTNTETYATFNLAKRRNVHSPHRPSGENATFWSLFKFFPHLFHGVARKDGDRLTDGMFWLDVWRIRLFVSSFNSF